MMVMSKERKKWRKEREISGVSARASIIGPSIKPYHITPGVISPRLQNASIFKWALSVWIALALYSSSKHLNIIEWGSCTVVCKSIITVPHLDQANNNWYNRQYRENRGQSQPLHLNLLSLMLNTSPTVWFLYYEGFKLKFSRVVTRYSTWKYEFWPPCFPTPPCADRPSDFDFTYNPWGYKPINTVGY